MKNWSKNQKLVLVAAIVLPSVILGILLFQSYAINKVKDIALTEYAALKSETDGDKAATIRNRMVVFLETNRLGLEALHLEQGELDRRVEGVYYRQSQRALASLEALRGDPQSAEDFRKEFFRCRKLAGPDQQLQADERVNLLVAINYLTVAARQGVKLTTSDLKSAGIIVPAVHKGEPVGKKSSVKAVSAAKPKRRL